MFLKEDIRVSQSFLNPIDLTLKKFEILILILLKYFKDEIRILVKQIYKVLSSILFITNSSLSRNFKKKILAFSLSSCFFSF